MQHIQFLDGLLKIILKKKHVENNAKIKQIHAMCEESKQKKN